MQNRLQTVLFKSKLIKRLLVFRHGISLVESMRVANLSVQSSINDHGHY